MIKIPATKAGLPAITEVIGLGISVNVTLIFSLERYREVMDAYLAGLEKAQAAGIDLVHGPLRRLLLRLPRRQRDRQAPCEGRHRRGARPQGQGRARQRPARVRGVRGASSPPTAGPRSPRGANKQRPLWASTGVKDPAYKDTLYVDELVAPGTVNTMPEATLDATADHGDIHGDAVTGGYAQARADLAAVERLGISYDEVVKQLEDEGVSKFEAAWEDLLRRGRDVAEQQGS